MKIKDLKEYLQELPESLDEFEIVFSEVWDIDETAGTWARKDMPVEGIVVDSDTEEVIFGKGETIDSMIRLSGGDEEE